MLLTFTSGLHWQYVFHLAKRTPKPSVGFIGRSTLTSCFIAACQALVKPALHLLGLGDCPFTYRLTGLLSLTVYILWIVDLELSSLFYSIVYCYHILKCGFSQLSLEIYPTMGSCPTVDLNCRPSRIEGTRVRCSTAYATQPRSQIYMFSNLCIFQV